MTDEQDKGRSDRCWICKYFQHTGHGYGECLRYPPSRIDGLNLGQFPKVSAGTWCGEFENKEELA